ncbi:MULTISPECIES: hypothetical protein [unclassified Mesorhizobium]
MAFAICPIILTLAAMPLFWQSTADAAAASLRTKQQSINFSDYIAMQL